MMAFRAHMQQNDEEVNRLREQLQDFDGVIPARHLDPKIVHPSVWANRHPDSFGNAEFEMLKADIATAGGNTQAIKVRPFGSRPGEYEIVFGHRRHRACLDLNLPVLALVEAVDDRQLFRAMDFENRARKDLSPWEQGVMYRRALDEGMYPSLRAMAQDLGVDAGNVSKAIALAKLPDEVVRAFPSPLSIQFRWGPMVSEALQRDPEGVVARAREIARVADRTAQQALDALLAVKAEAGEEAGTAIMVGDRKVGEIKRSQSRLSIRIDGKGIAQKEVEALAAVLGKFIAARE
jgi:ParB family chromosome partitioning protein